MQAWVKSSFKYFAAELLLYSALMFGYFFLVLKFLDGWLADLYQEHRVWYALMALALIIGQGVLLEMLTRALMEFLKGRLEG